MAVASMVARMAAVMVVHMRADRNSSVPPTNPMAGIEVHPSGLPRRGADRRTEETSALLSARSSRPAVKVRSRPRITSIGRAERRAAIIMADRVPTAALRRQRRNNTSVTRLAQTNRPPPQALPITCRLS
jgi:hypothetical protein